MLVVQQPDGTLAQVPAWMTTAAAGNAVIRQEPRLPLGVLRELRLGVDAALSLLSERDNGGRHGTSGSTRATGTVPDHGAGHRPAAGPGKPAFVAAAAAAAGGDRDREHDDGRG